jgi:hypothetical protein
MTDGMDQSEVQACDSINHPDPIHFLSLLPSASICVHLTRSLGLEMLAHVRFAAIAV